LSAIPLGAVADIADEVLRPRWVACHCDEVDGESTAKRDKGWKPSQTGKTPFNVKSNPCMCIKAFSA
jgi:hypothetical protein